MPPLPIAALLLCLFALGEPAAAEALTLGRGGPSVVARATGVSRRAIQQGMRAAAEIVRGILAVTPVPRA